MSAICEGHNEELLSVLFLRSIVVEGFYMVRLMAFKFKLNAIIDPSYQ